MNKEPGLNNPEVDSSRETLQDRGQKSTEGKRASEINYALEKEKVHAYEKEKEFASAEEIESATAKAIESAETERNNLKEEIAAQLGLNPNDPDDAKKIDWIATQYAKTKMQESVEAKAETELKVDPEIITANKGLKKIFLKIGAMALASAISIGAFLAYRNNKDNGGGNVPPIALEQIQDNNETDIDTSEVKEAEMGIKDGYGEKGMWLSENKSGPLAFASATEVAEANNYDEVEMTKYTARNQVESMADYLANVPEALQPEGFKGLNILETEAKLESLSDEDFASVQKQFDEIMDKAFTRRVDLNGNYQNAYMRQKDANGNVVHGNMELVSCTTTENNKRANQFYWLDAQGNEIGSMTIKILYDENGDIKEGCMQVINPEGSRPGLYTGMNEVPGESTPTPVTPNTPIPVVPVTPEKPDTPTPEPTPTPTPEPTPTPTPEPTPAPKNHEEADENSGAKAGIVTPEGQERQITEEPVADQSHEYDSETNTYYYTPEEAASKIDYIVDNGIDVVGQESAPITAPEEVAAAEEMVANQTAPEMVIGTREGVDEANDFDAGATVGTGEVTGDTQSADGSGNTIQENLDNATGNNEVNPEGDYSQGF